MRVQENDGITTVYIETEEERAAFMDAPDEKIMWNEGNYPILKRDIERVVLPRELYLEEPYRRSERLIAEMYKAPSRELETKLDVISQSVRERAGDGGITRASYDRSVDLLRVEYGNGTTESIRIEPPERQLQNMAQGREPVSARIAEQVDRSEAPELPETFTAEVMIDRPSSLEGDWISVRRTDTYSRKADGSWAVSQGIERDSAQELVTLEQQLRHAVLEAERLERKRREELAKEQADVNRGREDDGYIPGVYEPEYGH